MSNVIYTNTVPATSNIPTIKAGDLPAEIKQVFDACVSNGGYVDNHKKWETELRSPQNFGLFFYNDNAYLVPMRQYCCVNPLRIERDGKVHLSTSSVGGNINNWQFGEDGVGTDIAGNTQKLWQIVP